MGKSSRSGLDGKTLHEKQYTGAAMPFRLSLPWLRSMLRRWDVHREDVVSAMLPGGDRLLDVGCGSGALLARCSDKYRELYGVDIVAARVEQAEEMLRAAYPGKRIVLRQHDAANPLPFPPEYFDSVCCVATLEHIYDVYFAVSEMARVLRQGGEIVIEVPNIAYVKHRVALLIGFLPATSAAADWRTYGWDGGHVHYFTLGALRSLLSGYGLRIVKVRGSGLLAGLRARWPSLLTGDLVVRAIKMTRGSSRG
jgi:SAM-dependent methyltransferase